MVNRMSVSLTEFASMLGSNPMLAITALLTLGVILVNGWTDAPNAIATCVSTRAMSARGRHCHGGGIQLPRRAGDDNDQRPRRNDDLQYGGLRRQRRRTQPIALCAALFAIVAWATAAWWFGIPTSESHALIAGLSGAAIALHGRFCGHQSAANG